MSLSNFNWIIVYDDGTTETVYTDTIDSILDILELKDSQPRAIIKGYW